MNFQFFPNFLRHFSPVGLVLVRQNDVFNAEPRGGQHFFFDAADAHHAPAQADFAGHRDIRADAALRQQRCQGHDQRNAGAWAVLRRRARRHVNVDVEFCVIGQVDAQGLGLAAQITEGGLRAFLHDFAERTGEQQAAFAGHARGFDEQNFAADGRPGQAGGDAVFLDGFGGLVDEARRAQIIVQRIGLENERLRTWPLLTICRVALRVSAAISRSNWRTPASRV